MKRVCLGRPWFLFWLVCSVVSCTAPPPPSPLISDRALSPPVPQPLVPPRRVDNEAVLPWASTEPVFVVVDKSCQTLNLYHHGRLVRSYPAVLGRKPGPKRHQGDKRTPVGLYMIIGKRPHPRWSRFMLLDYPTPYDMHRYQRLRVAGQIPRGGGGYPGIGGDIGIHGSDHEALNRTQVNWTLGCISLFNHDMRELYASVPVGTLVYIKN